MGQDLNMRYVAAALLASLGGNEVTADSIKAILSSVGVEADDKSLAIVVKQLAGKSVEELVAEGLQSWPLWEVVAVVPPQLQLQLVEMRVLLPLPLRRRRKKNLKKRKMMIWDSDSSIKQYFLLPSSYMFIFVHFVLRLALY